MLNNFWPGRSRVQAKPHWKVAWVTGASKGLGRELALALASEGAIVAASARSVDALEEMSRLDPRIHAFPLDVTDRDAALRTARDIEAKLGPIDLAILNAGVWIPMRVRDLDTAVARRAMDVNYFGVMHCIEGLTRPMIARRGGHIALVGSVIGYTGMPRAVTYGPTKAALINLSQTMTMELADHGVAVTIINPGFLDTPMSSINKFPMPFLMDVKRATGIIVKGLKRRPYEIAFPYLMAGGMNIARLLPDSLFFLFVRAFVERNSLGPADGSEG